MEVYCLDGKSGYLEEALPSPRRTRVRGHAALFELINFLTREQRGLQELAVGRAVSAFQQTLGTGTAEAARAAVGCVACGTGITLPALPADTEEGNASKGSGKQDFRYI